MSFTAALEELGSAEIPDDAASLAAALRCHDQHTARLACAAASFARQGEWAVTGYSSAIAWLRDQRMTRRDAAALLRLGERMRDLPGTAAAWVDGRISGGQVQAICAQVIARHLALFQSQEAELVGHFEQLTVDETILVMAEWRRRADALDDGPEPDAERCDARLSPTMDNRGVLNASLDAEGYALATTALRLADSNDPDVALPLRRGAALKDIFRFFLDNQNKTSGGRHRPHLNVVVQAETIGTDNITGYEAVTGMTLAPRTLERLLCDCNMHRVMEAASEILDLGRTTKTPSVSLYNAVLLRDRHCRFPGCDRPPSWCDAHHVRFWGRDRGQTNLGNLVLLCGYHHTVIHQRGWSARLLPNGDFEVTTPQNLVRTTRPPGALQQQLPDRTKEYVADDPWADHFDEVASQRLIRARVSELKRSAAA